LIGNRVLSLFVGASLAAATLPAGEKAHRFEWTTKSAEAKQLLTKLQMQIENFQFGPANQELADKIVAADPEFAIGMYYKAATSPPPGNLEFYEKSRALAKNASDGERRFIEGLQHVWLNQGVDFAKSIEPLEALAKDYPNERIIQVILGQLYNGNNQGEEAFKAFKRAKEIGPETARIDAFLAGHDLLEGKYAQARSTYQAIEKRLPKGSVPFTIRFGITFSHLYEGNVDAAIESVETYLSEYKANGLNQQFPVVFIHNAIARINLENDRLDAAMTAYQKGYESVPGSSLPEDQKQTWLGRLHHGKARVLARMGKHEQAWAEAETVRTMIEGGGETAKQYWPAYHYLAGYVKLEAGEYDQAIEHLKQADPNDPFQTLLLARAYEKAGKKDDAKQAYQKIVASEWAGIERPLAYPEATRKVHEL